MATTYLHRTPSSTGNRKIWTISGWIKRCETSTSSLMIFSAGEYSVTDLVQIYTANNKLYCGMYNSSGTEISNLITSRLFRDTNAFYHIVIAVDTTQDTSSDRVKIYINGVQETAFGTENYPSEDYETAFNTTNQNTIGSVKGNTQYFDGIMSHVHLIDGTAYAPTEFGEEDSTTGEWKIKTSPSVTYGTNGFFILKDGNSITDQSGEGNNFTLGGGTLTNTEDCPSDVFATINPLSATNDDSGGLLKNGNTSLDSATSGAVKWYGASTLGFNKGKFYCEVKNITTSNPSLSVGVTTYPGFLSYNDLAVGTEDTDIAVENYSGNIVIDNSNVSVGYMSTWSGSGDICMLAVDIDNQKFYVGKDGVWADSDNPSTGTGGYSMSTVNNTDGYYFFAFGSTSTSYMNEFQVNFGNGYFGTSAISSEGTNASGIGKFEYDVPTGFTALSLKGMNS